MPWSLQSHLKLQCMVKNGLFMKKSKKIVNLI